MKWAAAWLVFLGKVGKAGDSPAHLRPIALLEPMGKALAGILKQHLAPFVEPWTAQLHLHGYLPFRSPQQALSVVFSHCGEVRAAAQAQGRSFYQLRAGVKRGSCAGGLQLSADFTQAFDCIDRELLRKSLEMMEVPSELTGLIMQWVEATSFYIGSGTDEVSYTSDRGIRQGCKLSPTLWVCVSVYLLRSLDLVLREGWSKQHAVGFADDLHFRWRFDDVAGLHAALNEAGTVLSKLQQLRLKISVDKTVCLLRADGVQAPHALRKITRQTKKGKMLRLNQDWELPLKKTHIYLGACISYENYEKQNMQHRLQACKAAFSRLRPTLMAHRALNVTKRLSLWKATVVTSATYSLLASGCTAKTFDIMRVVLTRQARAIARSPRHLELESDDCFWQRMGLESPLAMLRRRMEKAIETTDSLASLLSENDARLAPSLRARERAVLEGLKDIHSSSQVAGETESGEHICIECGARFGTWEALRAHTAKQHSDQRMQEARVQLIEFDRQRHGTDGMPTCAGCNHRFDRWADLEKHIVENHCQKMQDTKASSAPTTTRSVMQLIQDGDLTVSELRASDVTPQLREELLRHCALCRQWHPNAKYIKRHWQRVHTSDYDQHSAPAFQWRRQAVPKIHGQCDWCGEPIPERSEHRDTCPVLFQLSMVRTIHLAMHEPEPAVSDISFPGESEIKRWNNQCQLCGTQCTSRLLRKHFATMHPDVWNPVQSRVKLLCSSWAPKLGAKCQFCQGGPGKKLNHANACPEILQNALARVLQHTPDNTAVPRASLASTSSGDGGIPSSSSHARSVRASVREAPSGHQGGDSRGSAHQSRQTGPTQRKGQGQRKEEGEQSVLRLGQWFQRGAGLVRGSHHALGSHDGKTGGCVTCHSAVNGMGVVDASVSADSGARLVSGSSGLEERDHQPAESNGGDLAPVLSSVVHPSQVDADAAVGGASTAGDGGTERMVHQGADVGVPGLVTGSETAASRHQPKAIDDERRPPAAYGHEEVGERRHGVAISRDTTPHRSDERPGAHDGHGHFFQKGRIQRTVQPARKAPRTSSAPAMRSPIPAGGLQTFTGSTAPAGTPGIVCALILKNPSNFCYVNVTVRGVLWAMSHRLDSVELFSKTGREALKLVFMHNNKPLHIYGIPLWRMLLHRWGEPQSQHDASEFLAFLLGKLWATTFTWAWEARAIMGHRCEVVDGGNSMHAITLDVPGEDGPFDMQLLLNSWHHQSSIHALTGDAELLVFRLARYRQHAGGVVRNDCEVTWTSRVHIPVFEEQGLSSMAREFEIKAAIMHHGASLTCGHYTIMLHAADSDVICDDGVLPQRRPQPDTGRYHSKDVYMFLCRRLDPTASSH